jgi:hypothetical protein
VITCKRPINGEVLYDLKNSIDETTLAQIDRQEQTGSAHRGVKSMAYCACFNGCGFQQITGHASPTLN